MSIVFIRQAIVESGVRLDGRNPTDYRDVSINLIRQEQITTAEVQLGSTFPVATVSGVISTPYPDRPIEGQLNFSVEISTNCSLCGVSKTDLERMLERSIRESEAMDLESLWYVCCIPFNALTNTITSTRL